MTLNERSSAPSSLYRAVWRWHFFAGLLVLPFLVMMAITGGAYLFKPELDSLVYRSLEDVPARAQALAAPSTIIRQAEAGTQGHVLQFSPAERPDRAVRLLVRGPSGKALTAFADPYDGHLIGSTSYGGIMQLVRKIHSLQKFGFWASCLIEIAAGWAIVLVGTGVFLWWPRHAGAQGVLTVRGSPKRRLFWRDVHAVTGSFAALVIVFLAVTGMPWSMFWGNHVQGWVTAANLYEPAAPAKVTPSWVLTADMPGMAMGAKPSPSDAKPDRPWALEKAPLPMSMPMPMPDARGFGVDQALATFARLGLKTPFTVTLPEGADGAYAADYRPDRVEDSRTIYLDQYSGRVLGDVGFKDWGPGAKAIDWGIAVHQGQEYGPLYRYLMLAGCVAIVLLSVSAVTMWWKRRPRGSLGTPPLPEASRSAFGPLLIIGGVGLLYPLVGATFLIALAIDRLAFGRLRSAGNAPQP